MSPFWQWVVTVAAAWTLLLAVLAVTLRLRWRRTSLNPAAWIPAYLVIPISVLLGILFFLTIYPFMVVGTIYSHRCWRKKAVLASATPDGVTLRGMDSSTHRLLRWEELQQWRQEFTPPCLTYTAVLKSGERVPVDGIEDDEFEQRVREKGIEWRLSEDDEAIERGRLVAPVNQHGFVRCPHCGVRFPTDSSQFWDGDMHVPCRTRLRLIRSG